MGDVTGSGDRVGGLVGYNYYSGSAVDSSYAMGAVSGVNDVGGLVGHNTESVTGSRSSGDVTGSGDRVGGLVGYNDFGASVSICYALGYVTGTGSNYVGGLVGYNNNSASVSNSYARGGEVTGSSYVGGLVGYNVNIISNSYARCTVTGSSYAGGLVGYNNIGTYTACFWEQDIAINEGLSDIGYDSATSAALDHASIFATSTADMRTGATFTGAGWDFAGETANGSNDYWSIDGSINGGYPYLTGM
jgi:hypothetical protein